MDFILYIHIPANRKLRFIFIASIERFKVDPHSLIIYPHSVRGVGHLICLRQIPRDDAIGNIELPAASVTRSAIYIKRPAFYRLIIQDSARRHVAGSFQIYGSPIVMP